MKIYTIGFAGKKQGEFFGALDDAGVRTLADIRLWRAARFVPWASGANLAEALGDRYRYVPELSPTKELLTDYKNGAVDWAGYEKIFNGLLIARQVEKLFAPEILDGVCFLCTEKSPARCHRRLAAEYFAAHFDGLEITHLGT
ncbi:MAG: DUF488 domain-containing protein [Rickettsiales bacterium]|jgi:uncharacterized protein (DUF488 family)|nr:DUF488 domain-containing protein [Rickettsiales bacterium]